MRIGYCCINLSINEQKKKKDHVQVNRGMTLATFNTKGLNYVSELVIKNLTDLKQILRWNVRNGILLYRMSSDMFPWFTHYDLLTLPNINLIKSLLNEIGQFSLENNIRLSFHPSHFCVIASENEKVVQNTIDELNKHSLIMDLMGLPATHYFPINIHINTTKPTREIAATRFCENFKHLSDSCQKRLVVENDDKPNQYSVKILHELVHTKIGIPITFDQHHFSYGPQDSTMEEAVIIAHSTWDVQPLFHMSSSAKLNETVTMKETAHADYIYEKIQTFDLDFDVDIEAKMKDLAVIKYLKDYDV